MWGNIDLNYVMTYASPKDVKQVVKDTIKVASRNGGFILSTCNTMIECIPTENVLAMMEAAEEMDQLMHV